MYPAHRRHVDGSWPAAALTPEGEYLTDASEGKLRSKLTLLMYISEGFLGGATTFYTVGLIWDVLSCIMTHELTYSVVVSVVDQWQRRVIKAVCGFV